MKILIRAIVAAALAVVLFLGYEWVADNRIPAFRESGDLYVFPDESIDSVIEKLPSCRFGTKSIKEVFEAKQVARYLKAGHYTITSKTTLVGLARMLNNGWQTPVKVTVGGALRSYEDIAYSIGVQLMVPRKDILDSLRSNSFLQKYGFNTNTAYALFLPDTYSMWWTCSVDELFAKLKSAYNAFWTPARVEKAKAKHLSPIQASIVASIVRSESLYEPEYRQIAGVYLNRLRRGQRLQADPTVAFVYGYKLDRVLKKHLAVDSPYNTYTHKGLPPGPICAPTKAAIDAVLDADTASGNLYFCASPKLNGTHVFTASYKEHLANARAFQKACADRKKAAAN